MANDTETNSLTSMFDNTVSFFIYRTARLIIASIGIVVMLLLSAQ